MQHNEKRESFVLVFFTWLVLQLVGDDVAIHRQMESIALELCQLIDNVFDATQALYADYDMLNLP